MQNVFTRDTTFTCLLDFRFLHEAQSIFSSYQYIILTVSKNLFLLNIAASRWRQLKPDFIPGYCFQQNIGFYLCPVLILRKLQLF